MKKVLVWVCVLVLALSAVGAASAEGKRKVMMWDWGTAQFQACTDEYFATHPDLDWEIEFLPIDANDYLTKLQQSYASGSDIPDLLMGEIGWRASAFRLGIWENLEQEPYNLDRSIFMDYVPSLTSNDQGQIIALENAQNPASMAYKRDLAIQYLGTDDQKELEAMFQSYEDYARIGQQVYEASEGKVHLFPGLQDVATMMMNQKRGICNVNDAGELDVSAKVRPTLETLEALRTANACGNLSQWSSQWYSSYGSSDYILFPSASWSISFQIEPNDPEGAGNWGLFTPAEGGFGWGGTCYGIYNESAMKEEVWDYLKWWLISKEGADIMKESAGFFLPVKSLYEDPLYTQGTRPYFGDQQIYKFMMEDIASAIPPANMTIYDSLVVDTMNMIAQVMTADETVTADQAYEQFIADLQAKVPDMVVK